ncbi:MAG: hypothetical protein ACRC2T_03735 [Thermoguttaceae bacterium]
MRILGVSKLNLDSHVPPGGRDATHLTATSPTRPHKATVLCDRQLLGQRAKIPL